VLLGDWASAAAILVGAAARPDASALDGFLLALAHHHLGRPDEARDDCDGAIERLRADRGDVETRDLAVAAIMAGRGLDAGDAEALVLDAAFPADPFGWGGPPGTPREFFSESVSRNAPAAQVTP
jgi:hypothetical protein